MTSKDTLGFKTDSKLTEIITDRLLRMGLIGKEGHDHAIELLVDDVVRYYNPMQNSENPMQSKDTQNWEVDFDEKFPPLFDWIRGSTNIKLFIKELLSQKDKEWREKTLLLGLHVGKYCNTYIEKLGVMLSDDSLVEIINKKLNEKD